LHSPATLFLVGFLFSKDERSADFNICFSRSNVVVSVEASVVVVVVVVFFVVFVVVVVVDFVELKFKNNLNYNIN